MALREIHRLSARAVFTLTATGRHADGGNLYLYIDNNGGRRWTFLYRRDSRIREMGLGPAPGPKKAGLSLQDARRRAAEARQLLFNGVDPLTQKRSNVATSVTFGAFADELVKSIGSGFRNPKHRAQWEMSLKTYAAPLRSKLLKEIGTEDVLAVLQPIWETKHETASRVRGRIERVLDAARAKGLRTGDNPARWRGHLKELLSKRKTLTRGHHGALPYVEMPAFMSDLCGRKSMTALALEFIILTATRTSEAIGATWPEFDLENKFWTIPAHQIKAGREHRVPLTDRAIEILRTLDPQSEGFVFTGLKRNKPLSNMAMLMLLRDMRGDGVTVHGFRSTFRDWAAETTKHDNIVCEMALAHTVGNKVEEAYRRGDLFQKRQALMDDWARFLSGDVGKVLPMTRKPRAAQ